MRSRSLSAFDPPSPEFDSETAETCHAVCLLCPPQPVVFDAAYKPALTSLLAQAKDAQCPYVQGADMLVEQGLEQFQLWTERRAPRGEMEAAVFSKVDRI